MYSSTKAKNYKSTIKFVYSTERHLTSPRPDSSAALDMRELDNTTDIDQFENQRYFILNQWVIDGIIQLARRYIELASVSELQCWEFETLFANSLTWTTCKQVYFIILISVWHLNMFSHGNLLLRWTNRETE